MTPEPLALEVRALGARVGSRWIVRDVSFDARRGELVAVIGPNGAGKTTLLETIVGLRAPTAGTVRVQERDLGRFVEFARVFSFLPDAGTLPPEATVRTLIEHASAQASRGVELRTLMEGLTLAPLLAKPVGILSRGEHQRVALFCTLALGRPLAVLDEPFSTFDPLQLRKALATVRDALGSATAAVASFHQLADAERIANRILILSEGKMVAFGDLAALRDRVRSPDASLEEVFVSLLEGANHAS
jgi:ABC-2 type transport system ATP-binding protein